MVHPVCHLLAGGFAGALALSYRLAALVTVQTIRYRRQWRFRTDKVHYPTTGKVVCWQAETGVTRYK
ncbi:MAG: hypothetical protein KAR42_07795 [candidate division Zixibacteria bacterium]|nr:hypothetical protein [candidate division Zixibacteria bacterium]